MNFDEFIEKHGTATKQGAGAKLPIGDTGEFLLVVGLESKIGQTASWDMARMNKASVNFAEDMRALYARLVIGWSFDDKMTHKKVVRIFEERPALMGEVVEFAQNSENFTTP
jgi:hypothetical protein